MSLLMSTYGIPGGSVAVSRNGRILHARGFGYANLDSAVMVDTRHRFRIASISKPITDAALHKLKAQGRLRFSAPVFGAHGILNGREYSRFRDPRVARITVADLMGHSGGWDVSAIGFDPLFNQIRIAREIGKPLPISAVDIIRYVLENKELSFEPGSAYKYSNLGYAVLGRVIEKMAGRPYEDYVLENVLLPAGATGMRLGSSLLGNRAEHEVLYYTTPQENTTVSAFDGSTPVPWPYGGFAIESMDALGGWIASPSDLLRFLTVAPSDFGWFNGNLPGSIGSLKREADGFGWAILFNRPPENWESLHKEMHSLMTQAVSTR